MGREEAEGMEGGRNGMSMGFAYQGAHVSVLALLARGARHSLWDHGLGSGSPIACPKPHSSPIPYLQAGGAAQAEVTLRSLIPFLPNHSVLPAASRLPIGSLHRERLGSAPWNPRVWGGRAGNGAGNGLGKVLTAGPGCPMGPWVPVGPGGPCGAEAAS